MLLVPLGLADRAVHRVPVVTLGLLLANVLAFALTFAAGARSSNTDVLLDLLQKTLEEHPYLSIDPRLARLLGPEQEAALREEGAAWAARNPLPPPGERTREQRELDALVDDYFAALARLPWHRFGFSPAHPRLDAALTSMFMHAGWLHLLGNMLFLYASAPYVEEAYGRLFFALAYLASGLAAAAGQWLSAPHSLVPLVGASGAIAGVMGMVLVRLTRSWVRFLFLPIVFLPNVRIPVSLPAVLVLPAWALEQLWYAARAPADQGGVAWWAHVAGFGFGCVLALAVRALRLEDRWMGRSKEADEGARALEHASAAREAGEFETARRELARARTTNPEAPDVLLESYELAMAEQDTPAAVRALARVLEVLPRKGDAATALEVVDDGRWADLPDAPPRLLYTVAAFLERQGRKRRALELYEELLRRAPDDPIAARAAEKKRSIEGEAPRR